jgi:hypothetical protein
MHEELVKIYVEQVRHRVSERDCPVTPAVSVENMEDVIIELADALERMRRFQNYESRVDLRES